MKFLTNLKTLKSDNKHFFESGYGIYDGSEIEGSYGFCGTSGMPMGGECVQSHYEGEFLKGKFHGKGILDKLGNHYEGEFKQGKIDGVGKYIQNGGRSYEGEFVCDQPHGKGLVRYPDGTGKLQPFEGFVFLTIFLVFEATYVHGQRTSQHFLKRPPLEA